MNTTVFSDNIFLKTVLKTSDGKKQLTCTLRDSQNRYLGDLLRQDAKGFVIGRLVDPVQIPDWLVPGTILLGEVQSIKMTLTYEGVVQSRIDGVTGLLGAKVRFSYVSVSEFS